MPRNIVAIVFRGTGGVIGEDLVSLVCQPFTDIIVEENPQWPATMGGFPVGTAGGFNDVSMAKAVQIGFSSGQAMFGKYKSANPNIKVVVGGYSAGAEPAALLRQWIQRYHPENYLCSFSFGDPTRPAGGCFYNGIPTPGRGISTWHYGDVSDWRHCWLANPGDMYTSVPDGPVGDAMDTAYTIVKNTQFTDPLATGMTILQQIPVILKEAGIELPSILGALMGGPVTLVGWMVPLLLGALQGIVGGLAGLPDANKAGTAAAAEAAIIALKFVAAQPPTRPHISYHIDKVPGLNGMTFLDLARQHVHDWAITVPQT